MAASSLSTLSRQANVQQAIRANKHAMHVLLLSARNVRCSLVHPLRRPAIMSTNCHVSTVLVPRHVSRDLVFNVL